MASTCLILSCLSLLSSSNENSSQTISQMYSMISILGTISLHMRGPFLHFCQRLHLLLNGHHYCAKANLHIQMFFLFSKHLPTPTRTPYTHSCYSIQKFYLFKCHVYSYFSIPIISCRRTGSCLIVFVVLLHPGEWLACGMHS